MCETGKPHRQRRLMGGSEIAITHSRKSGEKCQLQKEGFFCLWECVLVNDGLKGTERSGSVKQSSSSLPTRWSGFCHFASSHSKRISVKRGVALFRMKRYGDLSLLTHGSGWVGSSNNKLYEITTHHDQAGLLSPCTDALNHLWAKAVTQQPLKTRLVQLSSGPDALVGV